MLECSVLTWAPAGEVPVTCLREGFSPSQGGVQNTPGHRDCLRVNCRHVFANTVRYIDIYIYIYIYIPEFLKTGLAKIRVHSTTWQLKAIKSVQRPIKKPISDAEQ